jgi:hypothetical protein
VRSTGPPIAVAIRGRMPSVVFVPFVSFVAKIWAAPSFDSARDAPSQVEGRASPWLRGSVLIRVSVVSGLGLCETRAS